MIKAIIAALLLFTLYRQIVQKENLEALWRSFIESQNSNRWPWLLCVILLMPVNWAFESLKWRALVRTFVQISFWKALQAILMGVTISMFTPNRIGEYGGRILMVDPEYNWRAVIATLVGSLSQLLVLLSFGLIGTTFFINWYLSLKPFLLASFLILGASLIGLLLFGFFNIDLLVPIAKRLPFLRNSKPKIKSYLRHLLVLQHYSSKILGVALLFAVLRYGVYSLQYYFILMFFGIEVDLGSALAGISMIYLIQTSVPLPPLMGLLARGEIALFVWSFFDANELSILAATFSLFIINLSIPAFLGVIVIVKINVLKSLGYEKENN